MSLRGIEAAVDRAVQQLSVDQRVQQQAKAAFLDLLERVVSEGSLVNTAAPAVQAAPSQGTPLAVSTQPLRADLQAYRHGAMASSLLTNSSLPVLEQLPGDLQAGDAQYNARETMLRERLNLPEIERRLRATASSLNIEYSHEDLAGVLRNAGYDAVHLGSSERYMAAVEKFIGEAENNYRQRAGNVPGSNA